MYIYICNIYIHIYIYLYLYIYLYTIFALDGTIISVIAINMQKVSQLNSNTFMTILC